MKNYSLLLLLLLTACGAETPPAGQCQDLKASNAWVREMPPGPSLTAGYLTLTNSTQQDVSITHISSPEFDRVEIHESLNNDGQMQMRRLDSLLIPASGTVNLSPGGIHLMLFDPIKPVQKGMKLAINFHCGETTFSTAADVRRGTLPTHHHHGHHGHHE